MIISKHISFFYIKKRLNYINKILNETNKYKYKTDIFIHTNENFSLNLLNNYKNGMLKIIVYNLSNIHPYYLTWKCRKLLKEQKNDYDIFMYIEDDILVPNKTIKYWLKYSGIVLNNKYNLGFVRIEKNLKNKEFIVIYCTVVASRTCTFHYISDRLIKAFMARTVSI